MEFKIQGDFWTPANAIRYPGGMVYRGKVQGGKIVLEAGARLAEGTQVKVELDDTPRASEPRVGSPEAIRAAAGIWADQSDEVDRLLAELKEMKEAEVRRQREEPDPQL